MTKEYSLDCNYAYQQLLERIALNVYGYLEHFDYSGRKEFAVSLLASIHDILGDNLMYHFEVQHDRDYATSELDVNWKNYEPFVKLAIDAKEAA